MEKILSLAKVHKLFVIEDAVTHYLPLIMEKIGNLQSDVSVFSFYANKTITTGEGGMLVTKNQKIADRARMMQIHGIDRQPFNRYKSKSPAWYYQVMAPGFKYNMTDLAASIGIHQLKKVTFFSQKREEIANFYRTKLVNLPIILPPWPDNKDMHSWHLLLFSYLHPPLLIEIPLLKKCFLWVSLAVFITYHYIGKPIGVILFNLSPKMFPNSESVYQNCISLPIYSKMSTSEIEE